MVSLSRGTVYALILAAQAFFAFVAPAFASPGNDNDKGEESRRFFLQGKIEHADQLEPLATDLRSGAQFKESKLSVGTYASKWFEIPAWFAGTFQVDENVITSMEDCVTGEVSHPNQAVLFSAQELHGFQRDAKGNIWHYYVESGTSKSEQARQITYNCIDWYGPITIRKDRVIMRILGTSLIVDKNTGTIVDSFRREDLKTYQPVSGNVLKVTYTSKSFDSRGHARDLQRGESIHKLIAPFAEIDQHGDTNYRLLFRDYLSANGKKDLLPANN